MCDERIFVLPVDDDKDELLTIGDLESQLIHIVKHCAYLNGLKPNTLLDKDDGDRYIGALTSLNRDEWTKAREEMIAFTGSYQENLLKIQQSLFGICLDDTTPTNPSDLVKFCAARRWGNRLYDKESICSVNTKVSGWLHVVHNK